MGRIILWPIALLHTATALSVDPLVHWSMDSHEGSTLLPDFGDSQQYSVDLTTFGNQQHFEPGVIGEALILGGRRIDLIEDIWKSDCIRNPSKCSDGLVVSFWLKVASRALNPGDDIILRSTDDNRSRPGIYIGSDKNDPSALLFVVRTSEGKLHSSSAPWSYVQKRWCHIAMTWNETTGVKVYINGSELRDDQYITSPTAQDVSSSYPTRVDLKAGDILGPTFLLDDLWIFYHLLDDDEIHSLYELGTSELEESDNTTTTSESPNEIREYPPEFVETPDVTTNATDVVEVSTKRLTTRAITVSTSSVNYVTNSRSATNAFTTTLDFGSTAQNVISKQPDVQPEPVPVTPYTGWFYYQPWFYAAMCITFLVMFLVSTWLCVTHCCFGTQEKTKLTNHETQAMSSEPLVQKE